MGLKFVDDLAAWQRWQDRRQPVTRQARRLLRTRTRQLGTEPSHLVKGGRSPRVVVLLESLGPTSIMSLLAPLKHIDPELVAVIAPDDPRMYLPEYDWDCTTTSTSEAIGGLQKTVGVVCALGHYLPRGAHAYAMLCHRSDTHFATVQHGIVTPYTPPLARGTHLLAWSSEDAEFWATGRDDISKTVVGAQMLWSADSSMVGAMQSARTATPTFLGQLHGAELDFRLAADSARDFCLRYGAMYRPHPAETDRRSRRTHRRWAAAGILIDRSNKPLTELRGPVVGAFSTGVLEAAAMGLPAWVYHRQPPDWLTEVWARYSMSQWEQQPTSPPTLTEAEPAGEIARELLRLAN